MFVTKKRMQEAEKSLEAIQERIKYLEEVEKKFEELDNLLKNFKEYEENRKLMKNSDEPWADFMTEVTTDGRVKVKFDWNKAMIQELRRMGFNAQSEEDIISAYFSRLISEHGEAMTQEELEEIKNA